MGNAVSIRGLSSAGIADLLIKENGAYQPFSEKLFHGGLLSLVDGNYLLSLDLDEPRDVEAFESILDTMGVSLPFVRKSLENLLKKTQQQSLPEHRPQDKKQQQHATTASNKKQQASKTMPAISDTKENRCDTKPKTPTIAPRRYADVVASGGTTASSGTNSPSGTNAPSGTTASCNEVQLFLAHSEPGFKPILVGHVVPINASQQTLQLWKTLAASSTKIVLQEYTRDEWARQVGSNITIEAMDTRGKNEIAGLVRYLGGNLKSVYGRFQSPAGHGSSKPVIGAMVVSYRQTMNNNKGQLECLIESDIRQIKDFPFLLEPLVSPKRRSSLSAAASPFQPPQTASPEPSSVKSSAPQSKAPISLTNSETKLATSGTKVSSPSEPSSVKSSVSQSKTPIPLTDCNTKVTKPGTAASSMSESSSVESSVHRSKASVPLTNSETNLTTSGTAASSTATASAASSSSPSQLSKSTSLAASPKSVPPSKSVTASSPQPVKSSSAGTAPSPTTVMLGPEACSPSQHSSPAKKVEQQDPVRGPRIVKFRQALNNKMKTAIAACSSVASRLLESPSTGTSASPSKPMPASSASPQSVEETTVGTPASPMTLVPPTASELSKMSSTAGNPTSPPSLARLLKPSGGEPSASTSTPAPKASSLARLPKSSVAEPSTSSAKHTLAGPPSSLARLLKSSTAGGAPSSTTKPRASSHCQVAGSQDMEKEYPVGESTWVKFGRSFEDELNKTFAGCPSAQDNDRWDYLEVSDLWNERMKVDGLNAPFVELSKVTKNTLLSVVFAAVDRFNEENGLELVVRKDSKSMKLLSKVTIFKNEEAAKQSASEMRKTKLCRFWQTGACYRGDECPYAHGYHELRDMN